MLLARWKVLLVVGLLASAALFVIGVTIERSGDTHTESVPTGETLSEGGSEEPHATEGGGSGASVDESTGHADATVLGIDLEAPGFVALAVIVSVVLAAAVWWSEARTVLVPVILFGLAFAVLDIAEVIHQSDVGRTSVMLVAAVVGVLHLCVAAIAAWALSGRRPVTIARP
jgi:vacuolar-type H+-ATPase subunit I/STV1